MESNVIAVDVIFGAVLFVIGLLLGKFVHPKAKPAKGENKIADIVEMLSRVVPVNDDVYDLLGILVSDVDDILSATDNDENEKQKQDALKTLDVIKDKIKKM